MIIPGWGDAVQERIQSASVLIAGAGGLGSPAALYLAAAGVGTIRIADSDSVDLSNLNRQILHDEDSLGGMKTDSARQRLGRFNSGITIETAAERIDDANISGLAEGMDIIIDCLDSFSSRQVLNRCSVRSGIPLIHAGISGTGGQLTVFSPPESGCLSCIFPETDTGEPEENPLPVLGAVAGILGTLEAMEAIKLITGLGEALIGRLLIFDALYTDFQEIDIRKDPECPVCGQSYRTVPAV